MSSRPIRRQSTPRRQKLRVAALFAGIGGIEVGLESAGHETLLFCENDPAGAAVLEHRFRRGSRRKYPVFHRDVRDLLELPSRTNMVTAGFPCQDLSQAGQTRGINGHQSGLVEHVFRLLAEHDVPWLLLENVPFMLQLDRGGAMGYLVRRLEDLGYRWAYRVVDSRAFGVPQRRLRVYLLASRTVAPEELLFTSSKAPRESRDHEGKACGFYWTEGTRGLGWAVDAVPTLKKGSTLGIPSPPAIWMPEGNVIIGTPDIRDAERMQGFPEDWTEAAEAALPGRGRRYRWSLVGNAVTTLAAEWIGNLVSTGERKAPELAVPMRQGSSWPLTGFGGPGHEARTVPHCTTWPVSQPSPALTEFLRHDLTPLSAKATEGFLRRLEAGQLKRPEEFEHALREHLARMRSASTGIRQRSSGSVGSTVGARAGG